MEQCIDERCGWLTMVQKPLGRVELTREKGTLANGCLWVLGLHWQRPTRWCIRSERPGYVSLMPTLTFTEPHLPSSLSTLSLFLASLVGRECYRAGSKILLLTQTENSSSCVDLSSIKINKWKTDSWMCWQSLVSEPMGWRAVWDSRDIHQQDSELWLSPGGNKLGQGHFFLAFSFPP